ncbi:MAG: transglutaminase family protein [Gemmataceae bacterium]
MLGGVALDPGTLLAGELTAMIIEIQHETRLQYSHAVSEWLAEFRVEPVSDDDQSCQTFHLGISQPTQVHHFRDGFGNRVHHFNLLAPNLEVRALAASVVETHPRYKDPTSSTATWPLAPEQLILHTLDFIQFRGPVRNSPLLQQLATKLAPQPGELLHALVNRLMGYIYQTFQYAKAVTHASSPIDDVLEMQKGVCQDFAHLLIGLLRQYGVPARYVSGYIHRPGKESQSHAWVEVWLPDQGWYGIDPTNNMMVNHNFVKVAIGRDFTDVPPNKGLYRGVGQEQILARVETRELDRLPTRSWQEQLPPLHVPLQMVLMHFNPDATSDEEAQQQQQQQQQ